MSDLKAGFIGLGAMGYAMAGHLHRAGLLTQRRLVRQLIYAADFTAMNALLLYLTDNCCGRGPTAANCAPLCPTAAAPLTTGDDDGKQ